MSPLEASPLPSRGAPPVASPDSRNLVNGRVHISQYDAKWPYLFKRESEKVRAALGDRVLLFEHVGSTAVPGMAAKPCVDLLLVVADPADEPSYLPDLLAAGYSVVIREPDWYEHRVLKGPDINLNLHVFGEGCEEVERMRLFRDHLIADAGARERYTAVKRELAERTWERIQDYSDAKTAVVEQLLDEARARRTASPGD
ncbi:MULTISPECIES: GrpB family protein [Nocardiopsis]|uniref:GrpB family protein n=1 Tax=Nocardiopsis tropica TaxID=109330 RepID=A0ABU7KX30_9ACTN|nr:GrpB family protein [Nocardiopsis umidischolae]MEE2053867.1 GrpB family protein [Nocardiopsis umidischolae]